MNQKPYGLKVNIFITIIAVILEAVLYLIGAIRSKDVYLVVVVFVLIWIAVAVGHYLGDKYTKV